ncbi:MAG TPA: S46 family peptidase [Pyrinomonadaceae bacterium]|nr:S46 family peptidase [Pyrinomonadaceae bacterium]
MRLKINFLTTYILASAILLSSVSFAFAVPEEGMFTPDQISSLPLKKKGLKIKPEEIYNPNGVDISDAVVRLSIGCSSEFVSPNGLILTNHHCGFDALVAASSTTKDYAKDGFKADNMQGEIEAKGYSVFVTNRVENVTTQILKGTESLTGEAKAKAVTANIETLQKAEQAKVPEGTMIRIQALNSGLFYYLYETMEIKDVRVVYAPPQNIGYYGGDPDNFEWSRHTGDFTFLRAYVAPDGKSAPYSTSNVPYKPKKFLTVSLDGIKENDFTMILGYPGGTTRYRESQAVEFAQNANFPFLVDYLKAWTSGLVKAGENDEEKRIKLQGEIFSLNNSIKAFDGGVIAMKRSDIISQKRAQETQLETWINADANRKAKYGTVLADLKRISEPYYATGLRDRILRTIPSPASAPTFSWVVDAITTVQQGKKLDDRKRGAITQTMAEHDAAIEREVIKYNLKAIADLPDNQKFKTAEMVFGNKQGKERRAAEDAFTASIIDNPDFDSAENLIKLYDMSFASLEKKYPKLVDFAVGLAGERAAIAARAKTFGDNIDPLRVTYQQAMAEMKGITPYPDANSTLRFTYGSVKGYAPREAVYYSPFTTLKGVLEKDTGVDPFDAPEKLKELQKSKDFGRFGVGDSVPVNFLTTNDIIGGNSGSPVLNGKGEQIGIAFDGNYEGLGNDIFFDGNYGRTIVVDIRYVLFLTEKFGGAGWILNEMSLKGGKKKS